MSQHVQTRSTDDHGRLRSLWFRWRGLIGYLVLAAGMIYSVATVAQQAGERREALAESARVVVIDGCRRDNETRKELREIIKRGDRSVDRFVREGTISKEQGILAHQDNKEALSALGPADCQAAADQIDGEG